MAPPPRPLQGVRIVDLTRLLPGPACTWYLQGLGAEVIKVESPRPEAADWARHMPPWTERGDGAWFAAVNAGKRSIQLDLGDEGDRRVLDRLIEGADVLVEGFRPGVMARLGYDPAALVQRHPWLVVASLSGFGQDGPLRDLPGHDLGYAGLCGALSLHGRHDGVPDLPGLQLADLAGGALTAALAICAALVARAATGRGRWLDCSITDGTLALMATHLAATAEGAAPSPGAEPLTGGLDVYRVYRCADGGLVAVAALEPKFQQALEAGLRRVLGRPVPLTAAGLADAFARLPRDRWCDELADACVTPVLEPAEVLDHPLHRARGMIVGEGRGRRVRPPFPGSEVEALQPPPAPGQHGDEIRAALGAGGAAAPSPRTGEA